MNTQEWTIFYSTNLKELSAYIDDVNKEFKRQLLERAELLKALKDAEMRILELCAAVNTLAPGKVREQDYAEKTRAAIKKAKGE